MTTYNVGTREEWLAAPASCSSARRSSPAAQFLMGDVPPVVAQLATASGTDPAGYLVEGPGLSAFALSDGVVYHTYSTYARGLEVMLGFYPLLDRVPKGRDEGDSEQFWIHRHDEY